MIQTQPSRRFVYADRDSAYGGHDYINLYWRTDLRFPYCGAIKSREYKATIRLYHPVTGRIAATPRDVSFGVKCT